MQQKTNPVDWKDFNARFFYKTNCISKEFCLEIRNYVDNTKFQKHTSSDKVWPVSYNTSSIPVDSDMNSKLHGLLTPVWEEAINYYRFNVDFTEPYEVKKYYLYDYVGDHMDQFYGSHSEYERKLSLVVQLSESDEYKGGDLKIARRFDCNRNIGTVIIFPSFYLHEVTKVFWGERYSINSWAWGAFWT